MKLWKARQFESKEEEEVGKRGDAIPLCEGEQRTRLAPGERLSQPLVNSKCRSRVRTKVTGRKDEPTTVAGERDELEPKEGTWRKAKVEEKNTEEGGEQGTERVFQDRRGSDLDNRCVFTIGAAFSL